MRYSQLLNESFRTAKEKFIEQSGDAVEVKEYIEMFKSLARKSIIKGQDKDISTWIKAGWEQFKTFIDEIKDNMSNRQQRHEIKQDAIKLIDNVVMTVIIPLSEKASCYYGKQTKWCTAATDSDNAFYTYFLKNITLIYVFVGERKLAVKVNMEDSTITYINASDQPMKREDFESITGIDATQITQWMDMYKAHIDDARDKSIAGIIQRISTVTSEDITVSVRNGHISFFDMLRLEPLLISLREYFQYNPKQLDVHKESLHAALSTVVEVMKAFVDTSDEMYVPTMSYGIGEDLLELFPPFRNFMKTILTSHYHRLDSVDRDDSYESSIRIIHQLISQL